MIVRLCGELPTVLFGHGVPADAEDLWEPMHARYLSTAEHVAPIGWQQVSAHFGRTAIFGWQRMSTTFAGNACRRVYVAVHLDAVCDIC